MVDHMYEHVQDMGARLSIPSALTTVPRLRRMRLSRSKHNIPAAGSFAHLAHTKSGCSTHMPSREGEGAGGSGSGEHLRLCGGERRRLGQLHLGDRRS